MKQSKGIENPAHESAAAWATRTGGIAMRLAGFVASQGARLGELRGEPALRSIASRLFDVVDDGNLHALVGAIDALGKIERGDRARRYVDAQHPFPDAIWPAGCLARRRGRPVTHQGLTKAERARKRQDRDFEDLLAARPRG